MWPCNAATRARPSCCRTLACSMADLRTNGDSSSATDENTNGNLVARSVFEEDSNQSLPAFPTGDTARLSPSEKACQDARFADSIHKAHSLHGAVAAKRQATTELLFFASVGDIGRIKTICETWGINVSHSQLVCCVWKGPPENQPRTLLLRMVPCESAVKY